MTTIAFDGKILATDSKQTIVSDRFAEVGLYCPHCNHSLDSMHLYTPKIEVPESEVQYGGSRVLAWAWAGNQRTTDAMRTSLLNDAPFDPKDRLNGTLVILTESSLHEVRTYDGQYITTRIEKFPYAAGSGRQAAMIAMQHMGSSPCEAITLASTVDVSTGGSAYFYSRTSNTIEKA